LPWYHEGIIIEIEVKRRNKKITEDFSSWYRKGILIGILGREFG